MSILGEIFGYDQRGDDLLGYPEDPRDGCIACGVSPLRHTDKMVLECAAKIYGSGKEKYPLNATDHS